MKTVMKSQSGFSLVELMVVVAIIGILASMSVGQVQKQIAKSRQSEAKTSLAQLYTAEKSFFAEFSVYSTDFGVIGLGYEGNLRYAVGFAADHLPLATAQANGFTGTPTLTGFASTTAACIGACTVIQSNGLAPAALAGTAGATGAGGSFNARANAFIFNAARNDVWDITNNKVLSNPTDGVN